MGITFYGGAHLATCGLYALATLITWRRLGSTDAGVRLALLAPAALALAILLHAFSLDADVQSDAGIRFGFAQDLSATMLLGAAMLWLEGLFLPLRVMIVLVAPLAALASLLPLQFRGAVLADTPALTAHLVCSVLAYGLLMIAAVNAVLMASMDRHLHQPLRRWPIPMAGLFALMPSLLALETLLFRQIAIGFLLLSATLVTGANFSLERYGHWFRFNHMTLFAVLSWLVFGGLLFGRRVYGWRGRVAQRWVLVGFLFLMLAYIGARFVLEVILGRSPA